MTNSDTLEPDLNLYAAYTSLPLRALAEFTGKLAQLSETITALHAEMSGQRRNALPELEVMTIHTGESVKFTMGERWLPAISSNDDDDIVIDVPKKLGIPLLTAYVIASAVQVCQDISNKHLDNKIKEIEFQLKETELRKTVMESESGMAHLKSEAVEFINVIQNNAIYHKFEINGVPLVAPNADAPRKNNLEE